MIRIAKLLPTIILSLGTSLGQSPSTPMESKRIQQFSLMSGPDQVHMLLHETSFLRKVFTTDFQIEEEILLASSDPGVDGFLATEIQHGNTGAAQEAVFMICERARFVRATEFPVKIPLDGFVRGIGGGLINPFFPDFNKVGQDANNAVRTALKSSNAKLRTTARIYCGELASELASTPASEIAARWRKELGKLPSPMFADSDSSETGELVRVLKRGLAAKGIEGAMEVAMILENESKPWARENEIEMIEFLDAAAVRLRGSQQGRDVLHVVEKTVKSKKLKLYKTQEEREDYWSMLQDSFFRDNYTGYAGSACNHWARFIALAFDQFHGEHGSDPSHDKRASFSRANEFVSYLTNIDPSFPSWEFPSTLGEEDMFHPKFAAKIARYHAAWMQMNAVHTTNSGNK